MTRRGPTLPFLLSLAMLAPAAAWAQSSPTSGEGSQPSGPTHTSRFGKAADPLERMNRGLYLVGGALDIVVIRPVSVFYAHAAPKPAREGVHNFLANLGEPVVFANRVLQLRPEPAGRTAGRFFVNSTLGVGGLFDVADRAGLKADDTNFGQTLARYGVGQGAYLFLPVLGPSTVRDATGRIVDVFLDPLTWIRFRDDGYFYGARAVMNGVDARVIADPVLKDVQKNSADPYATLRAAYLQNSDFLSKGGKLDVQSLPDFGPEPAPAPAPHKNP